MSDPAVPEGLQLAHTFWGEPDSMVTHAHTATGAGGVELIQAPISGVPYYQEPEPRNPNKCRAENDTCEGWRIADSDFCPGHAGILRRPKRSKD